MHAYIHECKHAHNASARRRPVTFRCNRSPETGYIQMKPVALMLAFMHACKHICMHIYMHICMHAYTHAYMHAYVHAYII